MSSINTNDTYLVCLAVRRKAHFYCSEAAKLCPENLVLIFDCPDLFQGLFQPL